MRLDVDRRAAVERAERQRRGHRRRAHGRQRLHATQDRVVEIPPASRSVAREARQRYLDRDYLIWPSRARLLSNRPAPATSNTASAICTTTSASDERRRGVTARGEPLASVDR